MIKRPTTCLLDSNIVIYLDDVGLLSACGRLAERGLARVAIPGEVKRELDVRGMPPQMQTLISSGTVRVICEPAIKRIKKRGNGEKHAFAIAQAMSAKRQDTIVVTSDKKALGKAAKLGLARYTVVGFIDYLYKENAITGDEKEQALQRLVDSGIISPRYGPSS